jgi:hypothetical protein
LLPADPYTFKGNLQCSVARLKRNVDKYDGNYKKALTAYKGISSLGRKQAEEVLNHSKEL